MRTRNLIIGHVVLLAAATIAAAEPVYRVKAWEDVTDKNISGLGQQVQKADAERWRYGEGQHVVGYAWETIDLDPMLRQAEFAYDQIPTYIDVSNAPAKLHLFLVNNEKVWNGALRSAGFRPDGLACQYQNEIYFKLDPAQGRRPDRVPHEVIHARLRQTYGLVVPLWLDEGVASYLGWRIAKQFAQREQRNTLTRKLPAMSPGKVFKMDDLTGLRAYPTRGESAQVFYRQSEELITALQEKIGDEGLRKLIPAVCREQQSLRSLLRLRYGFSQENIDVLERNVRERTTQERNE